MEEAIYKMKLHEIIHIDNYTTIRRVPGGWIYVAIVEMMTDVENQTGVTNFTATFVPFNNEFGES